MTFSGEQPPAARVRVAAIDDMTPGDLYRVLRLRTDVFVVEQQCAYAELDGRDLEPAARLLWLESDGVPVATLRVLRDADGRARIGRVATAASARGQGHAETLMRAALRLCADRAVVLDAQAHLAGWYGRFGFEQDGDVFVEDGIPHIPMLRARDH